MSMIPPAGADPAPVFPGAPGPTSAQPWGPPPPLYYTAPPAPPRPRTLGAVSMGIALAVLVLSAVASAIVGASEGPLGSRTSTSFDFTTSDLTPDQAAAFEPIGVLIGAQLLLGTLLGILALVLGIVAVATKRGRAFGIVGIVVAAAAPILSFIVYAITLGATLPAA